VSTTTYASPAPDFINQFAGLPSVDPVFEPGYRAEARMRGVEGVSAALRHDNSRWWIYVRRRLDDLRELREQPDGETPVPSARALRRAPAEAVRFMKARTPTPSVVPTPEGAVQFVWHKGGWDIDIEVSDNETTVWVDNRDTGASWHGSLDKRLDELHQVLDNLAPVSN